MIKTIQAMSLAALMAGAAIPALAQTTQTANSAAPQADQAKPADATSPVTHKKIHHAHHRIAAKKTEANPTQGKQ